MREKPLILLVDDEPNFLEIISMKLAASGFAITVAHNAKEAIEAAEGLQPDLILMDIMMPGETGTDAALEIKQNSKTRSIPLAFLSNMRDPWPGTKTPRDEFAQELGAEAFIDKSSDLDAIAARVHTLVVGR